MASRLRSVLSPMTSAAGATSSMLSKRLLDSARALGLPVEAPG
jgi:hypothetical protein